MVIQHNMLAMNASRMYGINNKSKAKTTERLSSGYRINRAADDAAGLAISEKMRRQVRGLSQSAENIQDGVSLCNVADGALNEIHDILQRQRELLIKAGNDTNSDDDKSYIQEEIKQLSEEFDRIFETTEFNERKIFKGHDEIIDGPNVDTRPGYNEDIDDKTNTKSEVIWLPKGSSPTNTSTDFRLTGSKTENRFYYTETEEVHDTDEHGHSSFDIVQSDIYETEVTEKYRNVDVNYSKVTDPAVLQEYKGLAKPKDVISSSGFVSNLRNIKGDMSLSCAMSQLGIKVDGQLVTASVYSGYSVGTTYSADGNTATTRYNLRNGLALTQEAKLINNDTYALSFSVTNTTGEDHDIELRFAFDTMNTDINAVNNGSKSFVLNSEDAKISISGSGSGATLSKAMLGSINDLYGSENWDGTKVHDGASAGNHTGTAYWWDGTVSAGGTLSIGTVNYGPIELNKEPWLRETVTTDRTKRMLDVTRIETTTTYKPEYLDIQSSTEAYQTIPIRLWNLSAENLRVEPGRHVSAFSVDTSLPQIDRAFEFINNIRSYYGATTNRLEHAYKVNKNAEENTQAAESAIRDADMAKESMEFAKQNILSQVGESMLAQANQSNQGILSLLQ